MQNNLVISYLQILPRQWKWAREADDFAYQLWIEHADRLSVGLQFLLPMGSHNKWHQSCMDGRNASKRKLNFNNMTEFH